MHKLIISCLLLVGFTAPFSAAAGSPVLAPHTLATLQISEIMYNPPGWQGLDGGDLEFLEFHNAGPTTLALGNFRITSAIDYRFPPDAELPANGYLVLAASAAGFAQKYGRPPFGVYSGHLGNGGEELTLLNAAGETVLTQLYSDEGSWPCAPDGGNFSLVLADTAAPQLGTSWRHSTRAGGSPGAADPAPAAEPLPVIVNEILAHTDAPAEDAIELYNPSPHDAYVGGWYLSDNFDEPQRYQLEKGLHVPANGYAVITESAFGGAMGFGFSENGEDVVVTAANCQGIPTGYRHQVKFAASPNGVSMGRYVNSVGAVHYPLQQRVTLGEANAGPRVGPLIISKIMYHPATGGEVEHEFIEVRNQSDRAVPLHLAGNAELTWKVDGIGGFAFPPGQSLAAGSRLLVVPLAPEEFRTRYQVPAAVPIYGPYTGALKDDGETITLLEPGEPNAIGPQPYYAVDEVSYGSATPWPSRASGMGPALMRRDPGAYGNDPANWLADDQLTQHIYLPVVE